ncbi:MAG: CoB--CoM heterodisulfide reductase subunit B [Candidatus Thorarchaeota archaeon]
MSQEYSLFLGCIMPNRYPAIESTTRFVLDKLGLEVKEMEKAGCCPAPGVFRSFNKPDWMVAAARNLAIAEGNGADLLTVCNGCFGTLFEVNHVLKHDEELKKQVNAGLEPLGYHVEANQEVKHIAQVLGFDIGPYEIQDYLKRRVRLKGAIHYGCHFLRPFQLKQIDDPEDPTILEDYFEALGVEIIDYRRKHACCGAGGGVRAGNFETSMKLLGEKMAAVQESEAEAILDICPFCHLQFDGGQQTLNKEYGTNFNIPIIHISQITAFAMGLDEVGMKYQATAPDFRLEAKPL